jgi:leucyl-tRNA synthetase
MLQNKYTRKRIVNDEGYTTRPDTRVSSTHAVVYEGQHEVHNIIKNIYYIMDFILTQNSNHSLLAVDSALDYLFVQI